MPNHLTLALEGGIATVTLSRPETHNALGPELGAELTDALQDLGSSPDVRAIVLAAEGRSFCAGADLTWMKRIAAASEEENVADVLRLARMFQALYECPKPVIARVHGAAFGGGIGLIAACDLAVALDSVRFCFSEVKLGLIPAVISPFVLRKVSPGVARRYFISAEQFDAATAHRLGLVSEVVPSIDELDVQVEVWKKQLLANGPEAMAACKRLLDEVEPIDWETVLSAVARRLAERRASAEGQEGLRAFLEKRPPSWHPDAEAPHVP